ncbi:MAG: HTTM domain-containing protein [Actinobacteria bacterium]|nr:HTTM domain-containing protein [Actinomycetota bacterium]MCA1721974.1 HTTM domain-containing protein [Actinomycetota bacterium]
MNAWRRWAFAPVDPAPMAALRIAVGLLTIGWTLSLLPDAQTFLGQDGVQRGLPRVSGGAWVVPLGPPYLVLGVLLAAAVALTVGWRTRVASVVVAVLLLAVQRRDPWILNSGDLLLRELAFFVMLMPAGETWSLDARRRGMNRWRAPWALRLVQLQISALYLFSVWAKVRGHAWNDGTAVGIALQLEDLQRFAVPSALATSLGVSAVLTYASLAVEAALAVGLWLPRLRYPVMLAGIGLHLGIEASLLIGWFSLAVVSSYVAFVPADDLRRALRRAGAARGSARGRVRLRSS